MNNNTHKNNDFGSFQESICSNMCQALRDAGLSQKQLADRLGTDKSYVSRILHGKQDLPLKFLWKFSNEICSGDICSLLPESAVRKNPPILQFADEVLHRVRHTNTNDIFENFEGEIRTRIMELLKSENISLVNLEKKLPFTYSQIERLLKDVEPTHFTLEFLYEFLEKVPPANWNFLLHGTTSELYDREILLTMCDKLAHFEQRQLISKMTPLLDYLVEIPYKSEGFHICKIIFSLLGESQP